jgi:hypothetical protein
MSTQEPTREGYLSWIQSMSITAAAVEPSYWPPQNKSLVFDYSIPTHEVYKTPVDTAETNSRMMAHNGSAPSIFASARGRLDYSYHSNPVLNRQLLQDAILTRVVSGTGISSTDTTEDPKIVTPTPTPAEPKRPWIVFTAGAMGVGKGYVVTQLQQANLFPAQDFCKIDPDMLKSELPEMAGYLNVDKKSAATQLHRESTQMADVLFEHAIAHEIPLLVDGSLRDVGWHKYLFDRIHNDYPMYRIAIVHITADRDVIIDRAQSRALKTGRVVPLELLEDSMKQVPESVAILSSQADAVHVIANNEGQPLELVSSTSSAAGATPQWEDFAKCWKDEQVEEAKEEAAVDVGTCPRIQLPIVCMTGAFENEETHAAANAIYKKSYPNFCARCAVACDGQCGVCIHGTHVCSCDICKKP